MPIEIRELIIKTEIRTADQNDNAGLHKDEINRIKKQLLQECKRIITENKKRNTYKR